MACVQQRDHTVLPATHTRTIPLLPSHEASPPFGAYSQKNGQAELTWVAGYLPR